MKEPGFYCFFLRCKKPKAEPFMESVVETVLPREFRKLASAIEKKKKIKYKPLSLQMRPINRKF